MLEEYIKSEKLELVETFINGDIEYYLIYENATREFSFKTTRKNALSSLKSFIKQYPFLSGMVASLGIDAIDKYRQNKRLLTRFFAKTPIEIQLYKKMSEDLVKTGKYKLVKEKRIHGGVLYELKRYKL
jgi:hypothetical protein